MIKRYALEMAAISLGGAVSATGALAQTYVAPGGSPVATAPGGSIVRTAPFADGRHDRLTTGSVGAGQPAADAAAGRVRPGRAGSRSPAR